MKSVLGILNLHDEPRLGLLTESHPLGAVTFLGRYALMDFALSNFSNSKIDRVAILVKDNLRSIQSHLRNGLAWINNTKTGFQKVYMNEKGLSNPKFNTDVNNILNYERNFKEVESDYVIVAPAFFLMSFDYRPLISAHETSGADVTVAYTHATCAVLDYQNCDEVKIDEKTGLVKTIIPFSGNKDEADISLEVFVFNRKAFNGIVKMTKEVSNSYSLRRMVRYCCDGQIIKLNSYKFDGYVVPMLSLQDYVRHSFELLNYSNRSKLFLDNWPIYTTTHNTQPSLYGPDAKVTNSFIANGSIIKGTVKNSIISRSVIIEKGAVVENSIVFTQARVGDNVHIKDVLADKFAVISEEKEVNGKPTEILYISQGAKI